MQRFRHVFLAVALVTTLTGALLLGRAQKGSATPPELSAGAWTYLSDLSWARASTEWMMLGNEGLPALDSTFYWGEPLTLHGRVYAKGLGAYAPSEMVYQLKGTYARFEALVGVYDDGLPGRAGARFLVFLDGALAYESLPMHKEDTPVTVQVPVQGINELRLVTVRSEDSLRGAHVAWADARLLQGPSSEGLYEEFLQQLKAQGEAHDRERAAQDRELALLAQEEIEALRTRLHGRLPRGEDLPVVAWAADTNMVYLVNNRLAVAFGLGGLRHGSLSVLDLARGRFVAQDLVSSITLDDEATVDLHRDTHPGAGGGFAASEIEHPVLGAGTEVRFSLLASDGDLAITPQVTLFKNSPVLLYRLELSRAQEDAGHVSFRYFDAASGGHLYVGEQVHYLADLVRLRHVVASDDGLLHRDLTGWGKPIYIWSERARRGTLLALVEETPLPPFFTFQLDPGRVAARVSLSAPGRAAGSPQGAERVSSSLLYLEVTEGLSLQRSFTRYRQLMAHLYPPPPLPSWFKYQWLSWYVYYMDISEAALMRQIDLIAEHFADLGPWHILVDAGWYVAEGREGAEWRKQDLEKFPRGLRWLVSYAHSKGVRVVLYFNAPSLNSRQSHWDWMGLRGIVEERPEWLVPLEEGTASDYMYNFHHPGLRAYLEEVMRDFFLRYDVDGIKLDGLGTGGETVLFTPEGRAFGLSDAVLAQTMEVYRFVWEQATRYKKDVYVESGWVTPTLANPYSHTFRYGDEDPTFSRPYPLSGLVEHIDYAAYQQAILGQRANMGAVYGDPNESITNRWWLAAGLALGAQVVLSFDLDAMSPETISAYRALLAPYAPFQGTTVSDNSLQQRVFSSQVGDTWYVGVLNRADGPRLITVRATPLGIAEGTPLTIYDVEEGRFFTSKGSFVLRAEAESFRLFVVRAQPGALWTNSHTEPLDQGLGLTHKVTAPPTVEGFLYLYTPKPQAVYWDNLPLAPAEHLFQGPLGYTYDEGALVLTIWYPATGEHTLRIEPEQEP